LAKWFKWSLDLGVARLIGDVMPLSIFEHGAVSLLVPSESIEFEVRMSAFWSIAE
jgi:hypothetical protein